MEFGLYVSSVEGHIVRRFGAPPNSYIGAKRTGKQIAWETKIVPIPQNEYSRYRAEYDGAIAAGALTKRTAEEYKAQQAKRTEQKLAAREQAAAGAELAQAERIHAIAETGATAPTPTDAERPTALLLDGGDR
jgi:ATPase subunit of ABC transporter with duplicated ATPase domains